MIKLQTALESAGVRKFITAVILFNAVILGLETSDMVMASVWCPHRSVGSRLSGNIRGGTGPEIVGLPLEVFPRRVEYF